MAVLKTTEILGPDYWLLAISIATFIISIIALVTLVRTKDISIMILSGMIIVVSFMTSFISAGEFRQPDTYVPTGKAQIEATFAKGEIPAYYLKKYDVIDKHGNIYILEEK